ncbi:transglycosylase SLT domain-containing protein [Saccharomonospora sp. NPDC046836]|uniref:transglycosylase SLT domain-containing protein n=1 Tax=Saccharomonospora sp. NPDC046836 TaxID=3156921 RepID=UPI0033F266A6
MEGGARGSGGRWRGLALLAALLIAGGWVVTRGDAQPTEDTKSAPSVTAPAPSTSSTTNPDPARYAALVVKYADAAGIEPRLLMAILYNESYKPHDPALQRAWQKMKPDAAFGIANMHKATYDEARRGRPFAGRDWQELPDDPELAIQAAAWHLHDLASGLSANPVGQLTTDELLALGYNTGAGNMRAFARGTEPGPQAQSYLDRLRSNWTVAGETIRRVG